MLDNLGNSFNSFTHVFWSGGDIAQNQANNLAKNIGGKTLGMTRIGSCLESLSYNRTAWVIASQNLANQVSNGATVRAILYYPGMSYGSIWFDEAKILFDKAVDIIYGGF